MTDELKKLFNPQAIDLAKLKKAEKELTKFCRRCQAKTRRPLTDKTELMCYECYDRISLLREDLEFINQ